jgi:quercetin dioxygenase-like cupin family protein
MEGFVRRASDGDARWFYGNLFVIKAAGSDAGGRFSFIDCTSPPGFQPGTHTYPGDDEGFYVLDGTLHGQCGTATWTASAGDLVFIPRDTPAQLHRDGASTGTLPAHQQPAGVRQRSRPGPASANPDAAATWRITPRRRHGAACPARSGSR